MQEGRICDFWAKRLSPVQQNYSTTMRETFAMVQAILHYRIYLIGVPFTVWTDHKPLIEWFKLVPGSQTYAKWMVKLQGLTFEVKYIEGDLNVMADLMSRPFDIVKASLQEVHEQLRLTALRATDEPTSEIYNVNATELVLLFDVIAGDQTPAVLMEYRIPDEKIIELKDAFFYDDNGIPKLIVPPEHVKFIIDELHKFGHLGESPK